MGEQVGWQGMFERLRAEAPRYAHIFPQLPRLLHQTLERHAHSGAPTVGGHPLGQADLLAMVLAEQRRTNRLLAYMTVLGLVAGALGMAVVGYFALHLG
jgi:ubiquinone biosynthesis protein